MDWTDSKQCQNCGEAVMKLGSLTNAPTIDLYRCFDCKTTYEFDTWTKSAKERVGDIATH